MKPTFKSNVFIFDYNYHESYNKKYKNGRSRNMVLPVNEMLTYVFYLNLI